MKSLFIFLYFIVSIMSSLDAKTILKDEIYAENFKVELIADNLNIPWGIDFLDKDRIIVSLKSGDIVLLNLKEMSVNYLYDPLTIYNKGQGGLLDVAVSKDFETDKTIYFTYSKDIRGYGATTLAKAKFINNNLTKHKDILVTKPQTQSNVHFGSRITFDNANHIFFSVGDRGERGNAQDKTNHAGSILRLNLDGSIPDDNPFIGDNESLREIYSFGHRNPQGLFYDKFRNILWAVEHGPNGGDELNIIKRGRNYGWPVISYGTEYHNSEPIGIGTHKEGMEQPLVKYTPSIAPSSILVYSGKIFPKWRGLIFIGSLKLMHINILNIDDDLKDSEEVRILEDLEERVRDIVESPDGYIYFSTDSGNLYKISPDKTKNTIEE